MTSLNEFGVTREEQEKTDLQTVIDQLRRGRNPGSGMRLWGGWEWAVVRLLHLEEEVDRLIAESPIQFYRAGAPTGASAVSIHSRLDRMEKR